MMSPAQFNLSRTQRSSCYWLATWKQIRRYLALVLASFGHPSMAGQPALVHTDYPSDQLAHLSWLARWFACTTMIARCHQNCLFFGCQRQVMWETQSNMLSKTANNRRLVDGEHTKAHRLLWLSESGSEFGASLCSCSDCTTMATMSYSCRAKPKRERCLSWRSHVFRLPGAAWRARKVVVWWQMATNHWGLNHSGRSAWSDLITMPIEFFLRLRREQDVCSSTCDDSGFLSSSFAC